MQVSFTFTGQELWPVLESILLLPQFRLWGTTIRWYKMTWHKLMTSLMGIFCAFLHSLNLFYMLFWQKIFSQNLTTNSYEWQKLLSACLQWNQNAEARLWGTLRWNKNQQHFLLACNTVKTNLSLFPCLSLSHITGTKSCGTNWNINTSFINLRLKYSQIKPIFSLPWTPARVKPARVRLQ